MRTRRDPGKRGQSRGVLALLLYGLVFAGLTVGSAPAGAALDLGQRFYQETYDETGLPTTPEVDLLGLGSLITIFSGNGAPPTSLTFNPGPGTVTMELDSVAGSEPSEYGVLGGPQTGCGLGVSMGVRGRFQGFNATPLDRGEYYTGIIASTYGLPIEQVDVLSTIFHSNADPNNPNLVLLKVKEQRLTTGGGTQREVLVSPTAAASILAGNPYTLELEVDRAYALARAFLSVGGEEFTTPYLELSLIGADPLNGGAQYAQVMNFGSGDNLTVDFIELELFADTIIVDSTLDSTDVNPGDTDCSDGAGACTLRAAIQETNFTSLDAILLPAGTYTLTLAGSGEDSSATGDLDVLDHLQLIGAGTGSTVIDGNGIDRVLDIDPSGSSALKVAISRLTVQNGQVPAGGGGGIRSGSTLTLTDMAVSGNFSGTPGVGGSAGGIESLGDLTVQSSTVSGNTAVQSGGGLQTGPSSTAAVINSTISGNSAGTGSGGGIMNNSGILTLNNSTITDNSSSQAGDGIFNSSGTVTLSNTVVADNSTGPDCAGQPLSSAGFNLDGDGSCNLTGPGDLPSTSPLLDPLQDNGGPTQTHALLVGSPALNAGNPATPGLSPPECHPFDQRGVPRPQGSACDIGAYENRCGDGSLDSEEECEDGNRADGDCCSATCRFEPPGTLCGPGGGTCTIDVCDGGGSCQPSIAPDGTFCDDGKFCTVGETCTGGSCGGGAPTDCSFLNDQCNIGVCKEALDVCTSKAANNGEPCDDGDACTSGDTCRSGACQGGDPPDCDDANVCTTDLCDSVLGCQNAAVANGTDCRDADVCNGDESCQTGFCTAGTPLTCGDEDGNPCTTPGCDATTGCFETFNEEPCDDGDSCTVDDRCGEGACQGNPLQCDDGNPCTDDSCSPGSGCLHPPNSAPCDDVDDCTENDACTGGACSGTLLPDSDGDGVCDLFDVCDDLIDADADGVGDPCDNCPLDANADQLNSDEDFPPVGDICDPCPLDPNDGCNQAGSAAGVVNSTAGGVVATADGSVDVIIPPGAVPRDTTISVTEGVSQFDIASGREVLAVALGPEGKTFSQPVVVTLTWPDADDDGAVDGFDPALLETDLSFYKDERRVAGPCGAPEFQPGTCTTACCDTDLNTWTVQVTAFSEPKLAEDPKYRRLAGKSAVLADKLSDTTKRRIVILSKDLNITTPLKYEVGDPSVNGATLTIFNNRIPQVLKIDLPKENWFPLGKTDPGKAGWKYLDKSLANGPCKVVLVKPGNLEKKKQGTIRAVCKATNASKPINYPLSEPRQIQSQQDDAVSALVKMGNDKTRFFCLAFGKTTGSSFEVLRDFGTAEDTENERPIGLFKARNAPVPVRCPIP